MTSKPRVTSAFSTAQLVIGSDTVGYTILNCLEDGSEFRLIAVNLLHLTIKTASLIPSSLSSSS